MIITITGKPCSGKGSVSKLFCEKYNFEYVCTGDMFRQLAKQNNTDITSFQLNDNITKIDYKIDNKIKQLGIEREKDDVVIDSRLAWHFVKNSFKVFIDVDIKTASKRLLKSNRDSEQVTNLKQAEENLKKRWQIENDRYTKIYNVNNLNIDNYDLVINSTNLTVDEIVEIIYENYKKFLNCNKKSKI